MTTPTSINVFSHMVKVRSFIDLTLESGLEPVGSSLNAVQDWRV